jgi:raffinose/stachyose/melibiose transport system substrate-binding protein
MNFKQLLKGAISIAIVVSLMAGCSQDSDSNQTGKQNDSKNSTLKLAMFSSEQSMAYDKLKITDELKKAKNIDLQIEKFKDSTEFENAMKIRNAANQIPDIMGLKPYQLSMYKDILAPLDDTTAAQNNTYAKNYAIDGKIIGVPECSFNEFVWYRKSVFKELNLSVPTTWNQFLDVSKKIKDNGKYIPILMGQKDDWTNYPVTEFFPCILANDGSLWNKMATQDEPFGKDASFYKAFTMWKQLCDTKVFGKDPLGAGFDQVKVMFGSKKGAMILSGAWFISEVQKQLNNDLSDVGTFFLPARTSENEAFKTITMVDGFLSTPKNGKNIEAAKTFINWYMDKGWYAPYIKERGLISTSKDVTVDLNPVLQEAYNSVKYEQVIYDSGNTDFIKMQSASKFNFKKMGQDVLAGKDMDKMMEDMNKAWKAARKSN